jgi:hypothetical protein
MFETGQQINGMQAKNLPTNNGRKPTSFIFPNYCQYPTIFVDYRANIVKVNGNRLFFLGREKGGTRYEIRRNSPALRYAAYP